MGVEEADLEATRFTVRMTALNTAHNKAVQNLQKAQEQQAKSYKDRLAACNAALPSDLKPGQRVYYYKRGGPDAYRPIGPYFFKLLQGPKATLQGKDGATCSVNANALCLRKEDLPTKTSKRPRSPSNPVSSDEECSPSR